MPTGYPALFHIANPYTGFFASLITNLVAFIVSLIIAVVVSVLVYLGTMWIWGSRILFINGSDGLSSREKQDWKEVRVGAWMVAIFATGLYGPAMIFWLQGLDCPTSIEVYVMIESWYIGLVSAILVISVLLKYPLWCYTLCELVFNRYTRPKKSDEISLADSMYE